MKQVTKTVTIIKYVGYLYDETKSEVRKEEIELLKPVTKQFVENAFAAINAGRLINYEKVSERTLKLALPVKEFKDNAEVLVNGEKFNPMLYTVREMTLFNVKMRVYNKKTAEVNVVEFTEEKILTQTGALDHCKADEILIDYSYKKESRKYIMENRKFVELAKEVN